MKRSYLNYGILLSIFLGGLIGCNGVHTDKHDDKPPRMENEDVVIVSRPSNGLLDVSLQSARLKEGILAKKPITQVLFDICNDFDWFRPYQIFLFNDYNNKYNNFPTYVYLPKSDKSPDKLVDKISGRIYPLEENWCEEIRKKQPT